MDLQEKFKPVLLPSGLIIYQFQQSQGISSDTSNLVQTVLEEESSSRARVMDAGCGNGIIALMLKLQNPGWEIKGIDIEPDQVELAEQNNRRAKQDISFFPADIKNFHDQTGYDLIISNPPYFPLGHGRISPSRSRAVARHEICCDYTDLISFCARNLKPQGRAYFLNLMERKAAIVKLALAQKLKLDRIYDQFPFQKKKVIIYRLIK